MPTCNPVNLPVVATDFCNPNVNFGQIDKIYLGNPGNDFTDWSLVTEWTARVDNANSVDDDAIRELPVIGDKPAPERNEIAFSNGRKVYTTPKHSVNVKLDETGDENYALLRFLDLNAGQELRVWYSAGKYLYGGNSGVPAVFVLDDVIPESDEELNTFQGVLSWEGIHPERILNPIS
tara:strand:+ start:27783 stop:28316 length:534 start_codon:yes stop_codon:yes gene_type:complete